MSSEEQPPLVGNYRRPEPRRRSARSAARRFARPTNSARGAAGGSGPLRLARRQASTTGRTGSPSRRSPAPSPLYAAPIIGSICAIYLEKRAQENLRRNPGLQGEGLAQAGIFIGWASIVLGILLLMIGISVLSSSGA